MKFAHVATRWIGTGVPPDDKYRPDMPMGSTRRRVLGYQYVDLALGCPKPNIAVVLVEESRAKHEGYINSLKANLNQIVIEEWEDDWPVVPVATAAKLKNFLVRQGMGADVAEYIVKAPEGPRNRTEVLLEELSLNDLRAQRRIEIEGYSQ